MHLVCIQSVGLNKPDGLSLLALNSGFGNKKWPEAQDGLQLLQDGTQLDNETIENKPIVNNDSSSTDVSFFFPKDHQMRVQAKQTRECKRSSSPK